MITTIITTIMTTTTTIIIYLLIIKPIVNMLFICFLFPFRYSALDIEKLKRLVLYKHTHRNDCKCYSKRK